MTCIMLEKSFCRFDISIMSTAQNVVVFHLDEEAAEKIFKIVSVCFWRSANKQRGKGNPPRRFAFAKTSEKEISLQ